MTNEIWKHDTFNNHNIVFTFNKEIIEYDLKEAGFSLTKEYNLLDKNTIKVLEKYKKDKRKIELGLIQRDNKEYRESLKEVFKEARRKFIEYNELEQQEIIRIWKEFII